MNSNIGKIDRLLRIILGGFLSLLFLQGSVLGIWSIVTVIAAGIMFLTSLTGTCPIYTLLNINTFATNK